MRHPAWPRIGALAIALLLGPDPARAEEPADDARFDAVAARYHQAIRKRPYRGPTFDLWYRHYLDAGQLDRLLAEAEGNVRATPDDLAARLVLGLVYERKGRGDDAARAYREARRLDPRRFEPPALLGTLLFRLSRFEEAAPALADAIGHGPPRHERLDLLKRLGQSYQRVGKVREAVATWSRIADEFPNDRRVLAELAELIGDEGQIDEAIGRWERVIALSAKDPHQQLTAQLEIAALLARKERFPQALERLGQALDRVEPDSWLAQDIHRRVEALFLKRGDVPGLLAFYSERCRLRPDDLAAARQLAAALTRSGKVDEAIARYRASIAVAPRRRDLREALIGTLERAGRYDDALAECRALSETEPRDPDLLKRLGQLTLMAASGDRREGAEREAIAIWDRLAKLRPDDAAAALQAAEMCRAAAMQTAKEATAATDASSPLLKAAESYYREAVRRSRGAAVPCEALGEFLHARGRSREAVAAWSEMAAPPADTPASWRRLAEVLDHFGYLPDARAASAKALAGAPDDVDAHRLRMRLAVKARDFDQALGEAAQLERLADRPRRVEQALQARVDVWEAAGLLEREVQRLQAAHRRAPLPGRDAWLLGLLLARSGKPARAASVLEGALATDPDNLLMLRTAAEVHEEAGHRLEALRAYRRLAEREPAQAVVHLGKIASLELQVGSAQAAKAAAENLLQRHPGDPDGYRLRADIAFQLGEPSDGLAWLQRAVRAAPRDLPIRLELAHAVARHGPADEAAEHYWRCLELAESLDDKREVVGGLVGLAQANRTQDQLLHRLRQLRDSQSDAKPLTLCLVEALRALGDLGGARAELEKAVAASPDDLGILKSLAGLAAAQQDWAAAVSVQERVAARAPEAAHLEALADYLQARGDTDAADRALLRLLEADEVDAFTRVIEHDLDRLDFPAARRLAEAGVRRRPESWRLRFLSGTAQLATKDAEAAAKSFEAMLALPDEGTPGPAVSPSIAPRPATPRTMSGRTSLPRPAGGIATRKSATSPLAAARSRARAPLDEVPKGKLPELDDIRDTLAGWVQWQSLVAVSRMQIPARSPRQSSTARRAPTPAVNSPAYQQLTAQYQQAQAQLQLAQQAQQMQEVARLTNEMATLRQQILSYRALQAGNPAQMGSFPSGPWRLAGDQRSARRQGLMGLAAAHRQEGEEDEWLRHLRQAAGSDPERGRWLVLAALALDRPAEARPAIADLVRSQPDDAFPHVARLFLRRPGTPGASPPTTAPEEEEAAIRESARWLIARRPDLRDELTCGLLNLLIAGMGPLDEATRVLASAVATAELEVLPRLAGYAASLGDVAIQRSVMARAAELAGDQPDVPATPVSLHATLTANVLYSGDRAYLESMLTLLDRCLESEDATPLAVPPPPPVPTRNPTARPPAFEEFPPPSPGLDALRLDALRLVYVRYDAVDQVALLADHLARRAGSSTGRARLSYRLAMSALTWWRGKPTEALAALEAVSGDTAEAEGLSLVLARGHFLQGEMARALAALDASPADSITWAVEFDGLRTAINERLRAGTPDQILDAALFVLQSRTREPDLGFLFAGPARSSRFPGRQPTAAQQAAAQQQMAAPGVYRGGTAMLGMSLRTMTVPNPTVAGPRRSLDELLKRAQVRGTLDALEQAADAQWGKHPGDAHLGALVTLARFQRDDIAGAATAAERWGKVLATRPEVAGAAESLRIVAHCLDHQETRALGRRLARQVLPTARARGMTPELTDLTLSAIQAAVLDGEKDEALEELRRFREALPKSSRPGETVR